MRSRDRLGWWCGLGLGVGGWWLVVGDWVVKDGS